MEEKDERPPRSRGGTLASRRSSRSRANSSPSRRQLNRVLSGNYLDDHSHYDHHPHSEAGVDDADCSDDAELTEKDSRDTEESPPSGSNETLDESATTHQSIVRDVEAGPKLKKEKSSRSVRDPNLVAWDGPDDTENPKNWSMKRKWAATLIGKYCPLITLQNIF